MAGGGVAGQAGTGTVSGNQAGRRFRAFIRTVAGASVQEVRMMPLRDDLVAKIRSLLAGPPRRKLMGGRDTTANSDSQGADYVVATVGADTSTPKLERGPDPTGIVPTRQAWEMTCAGGNLITLGLPRGNITLPAVTWSNRGRHHHAGQYGGVNAKSDVPRFIKLIDMGQFDPRRSSPRPIHSNAPQKRFRRSQIAQRCARS